MLSFRASIVVTMLATFALSLGVMLWQRRAEEAPMPNPATLTSAVGQRPATPVAASASLVQSVAQPVPVQEERKLTSLANGAPVPSSTDPAQMPVQIVFKHRDRLNKFEARIVNTSGDSLSIDVSVLSASTHHASQTQVDVGAYLQSRFGIDDGLDMQSGDQVTLRRHPYRDLVMQIP
jgi:hypothetical protein